MKPDRKEGRRFEQSRWADEKNVMCEKDIKDA